MLFSPAVGFVLVLPARYAHLAVIVPVLLHLLRSSFLSPLALWLWFCLCFLQRHFVVVCDSVVRFWPPPTPLLSIASLRDCWFAVGALAPRIGSLPQRVLLTMRIGFSFARYFSFTCLAEMSVPLFKGCVHPHEVKVFIAARDSGQQ